MKSIIPPKTLSIPMLFTVTTVVFLTLCACNVAIADDSISLSISERFVPKLERSFSAEERHLIIHDFESFTRHRVDFGVDQIFSKGLKTIFGGSSNLDILNFLDERISYLYPPSADPRVTFSDKTIPSLLKDSPFHTLELAKNMSAPLWFAQVQRPERTVLLRFNDQDVPVDSTRIGSIQLKQPYFALAGTGRFSSLYRIAKLVHEARHSDCLGELNDSDVARIQNHQLPLNLACGHPHVVCPETYTGPDGETLAHPYAALLACDRHAWGAYSIESAFALGLNRNCTNCSEAERQEMQAIIIDNSLRTPSAIGTELTGKHGLPKMSNRAHSEVN